MKTYASLVLCALFAAAGLASAEPLVYHTSFDASSTSTTSTSMVNGNTPITLTDVFEGTEYFVFYRASFGGNDNAQVGEVEFTDETDVLGLAAGEGAGSGAAHGGGQLQGFARVTKDAAAGTFYRLRHRNITSSDTNFIGARALVMIPLNQSSIHDPGVIEINPAPLKEDGDFFYAGTNSATAVASSITNSWTTVLTEDWNIGCEEASDTSCDYAVFFSVEGTPGAGSASDAVMVRFQIDGVTQGAGEYLQEWEDNTDRYNFAISDLVTLNEGTRTFRVQMQNRNALASVSAYRPRMWAFRREAFSAMQHTVDTTGDSSVTNTSYANTDILLSTDTDNTKNAGSLVFATVNLGYTSADAVAEMRILSGGATCVDSGDGYNDFGLGSDDDMMPTVMALEAGGSPGVDSTVRVRQRVVSANTGTIGRNLTNSAGVRSNLLFWEMFVPQMDPISSRSGIVPPGR